MSNVGPVTTETIIKQAILQDILRREDEIIRASSIRVDASEVPERASSIRRGSSRPHASQVPERASSSTLVDAERASSIRVDASEVTEKKQQKMQRSSATEEAEEKDHHDKVYEKYALRIHVHETPVFQVHPNKKVQEVQEEPPNKKCKMQEFWEERPEHPWREPEPLPPKPPTPPELPGVDAVHQFYVQRPNAEACVQKCLEEMSENPW